jgi:tyrosine-protein phosphatase YwqE
MSGSQPVKNRFTNEFEDRTKRIRVVNNSHLHRMPQIEKLEPSIAHITFGDLHGNSLKLIHQLIQTGFISNMTDQSYDELFRIYTKKTDQLTEPDLLRFKEILDGLEIDNRHALTLIGDELCDRGRNDYFTLLILNKLHKAKVDFDVTVSNHSIEFIRDADKEDEEPFLDGSDYSLKNYIRLKRRLKTEFPNIVKECDDIISQVYKPRVKAISYTFNPLTQQFSLYSHAPIDLRDIRKLCDKYDVKFADSDVYTLMHSIDQLNAKIADRLTHRGLFATMRNGPLENLIWNRGRNWDDNKRDQYLVGNGFTICFVHGHVGTDETPYSSNHENTDNDFGKGEDRVSLEAPVIFRVTSGLNKLALEKEYQSLKDLVSGLNDEAVKNNLLTILSLPCRYHTNVFNYVQRVIYDMSQKDIEPLILEKTRDETSKYKEICSKLTTMSTSTWSNTHQLGGAVTKYIQTIFQRVADNGASDKILDEILKEIEKVHKILEATCSEISRMQVDDISISTAGSDKTNKKIQKIKNVLNDLGNLAKDDQELKKALNISRDWNVRETTSLKNYKKSMAKLRSGEENAGLSAKLR